MNEEREAYERFMRKQHVGRRRAGTALGSGALRGDDIEDAVMRRCPKRDDGIVYTSHSPVPG